MNYEIQKKKLQKVLQRPILTSTLLGFTMGFKTEKVYLKVLYKVYSFLNPLTILIITCQLCNELFGNFEDITKYIEILLISCLYATAFIVMILYRIKFPQLKELLNFAYENFRFHSQFSDDDLVTMEPVMDQVNLFLPLMIGFTVATGYQWLVLPLLYSGPGSRLLPAEVYYPYSAHETPYYELTFVLQAYTFTCLAFTYANISCVFITLTAMVCTQFDILCCNIMNSANDHILPNNIIIPSFNNLEGGIYKTNKCHGNVSTSSNPEDLERNSLLAIADCVEYHQKLRKFCRKMEYYFDLPLSIQLIMIVFAMGCAVLSFLQRFAIYTAQFMVLSVLFLLIICFQGQQILHKSGNIHEAVWASRWLERGTRVRRAYIILMQQGLRPRQLAVGYGLFHLNLDNLVAILKACFSFFTLLSNLIDTRQD